MKTTIQKFLATGLLACLPLVTGCSKDSNPMAPTPKQPEYVDVTVTLVRLLAVADGDGIEGPGDFTFNAQVYDGAPATLVASGSIELETGSTYALNKSRVIRAPKDANYRIKVDFTATEWDRSIFGVTYPDTRMDNLNEFRIHSDAIPSATFNDGERWITLGTGDLQFRLIYTITSKPVVQ